MSTKAPINPLLRDASKALDVIKGLSSEIELECLCETDNTSKFLGLPVNVYNATVTGKKDIYLVSLISKSKDESSVPPATRKLALSSEPELEDIMFTVLGKRCDVSIMIRNVIDTAINNSTDDLKNVSLESSKLVESNPTDFI